MYIHSIIQEYVLFAGKYWTQTPLRKVTIVDALKSQNPQNRGPGHLLSAVQHRADVVIANYVKAMARD